MSRGAVIIVPPASRAPYSVAGSSAVRKYITPSGGGASSGVMMTIKGQ